MSPLRYTMKGRVTDCVLLSFRTPRDHVKGLLPRGFKLLTHNNMAFWNVCICTVESLHPATLPFVRLTYRHVSYRLMVRVPVSNNKELRGLYFVRSDADNGTVCSFGNMLTDFKFNRADIVVKSGDGVLDVSVENTRDGIADSYFLGERTDEYYLPPDSCFADPEEARKILRYTPTGMSLDKRGRVVDLAEVERDEKAWKEAPMRVARAGFAFFRNMDQPEAGLETAVAVDPVDYVWRLGGTALLN